MPSATAAVASFRDTACEYADRGWAILPLTPRAKQPLGRLVPHGLSDASSDPVQVLRWWNDEPEANIGINCHESGLVVIDVDPRNGGQESFAHLAAECGEIGPTLIARTGGGGFHAVFNHPLVPLVSRPAEGVDVKDHGYFVAPPSVHPSGSRYEWELGPDDFAVLDLPGKWLERLTAPVPVRRAARADFSSDDPLRQIPSARYVEKLSGRAANEDGFVTCPFHRGGKERTPSLLVTGTVWCCYGCEPVLGKRTMGGDIFDFAAALWGFPMPPSGLDYSEIRSRLEREFA